MIVWVSLPSAFPCHNLLSIHTSSPSVGVAPGQTLSHLILALEAQSNAIIALSVTDDWDLQRVLFAPVPVHLCVRRCGLIKGRPAPTQAAVHEPVGFSMFPLTAVTSLLPWVARSACWLGEVTVIWAQTPLVSDESAGAPTRLQVW